MCILLHFWGSFIALPTPNSLIQFIQKYFKRICIENGFLSGWTFLCSFARSLALSLSVAVLVFSFVFILFSRTRSVLNRKAIWYTVFSALCVHISVYFIVVINKWRKKIFDKTIFRNTICRIFRFNDQNHSFSKSIVHKIQRTKYSAFFFPWPFPMFCNIFHVGLQYIPSHNCCSSAGSPGPDPFEPLIKAKPIGKNVQKLLFSSNYFKIGRYLPTLFQAIQHLFGRVCVVGCVCVSFTF